MPNSSVKLENASWLITVDDRRRVLRDASILVESGKIVAVDKTEKLKGVKSDRVIDARHKVVAPGFVNTHMHISYAHAVRGIFPDDLPQQAYLGHVFRFQAAMKPEEEYYTSLLAIVELLRNGCTTILEPGTIKSLESGLRAIEETGIRAIVGKSFVDQPNPLNLEEIDTDKALRLTEQTIAAYNGRLGGKVKAWAMPFSPDYCSDRSLQSVKEIADKFNVGVTTHISQSQAVADNFAKAKGRRPIEYLAERSLLGPNLLLAHALSVNDTELDLIAKNSVKVAHCPSASLRGSGVTRISKVPEMLERGVTVGLGNDAANSSYYLDMIRVMYLASVLYKDARQERGLIPPETAIEMGTLNGAKALLMEREIGSIEVGKRADLILFETRRPEWRSLFNPVNTLVYSADGRSIDTVLIDGETVVENGKVHEMDEEALITKVQETGEDIVHRLGVSFKYKWPLA